MTLKPYESRPGYLEVKLECGHYREWPEEQPPDLSRSCAFCDGTYDRMVGDLAPDQ